MRRACLVGGVSLALFLAGTALASRIDDFAGASVMTSLSSTSGTTTTIPSSPPAAPTLAPPATDATGVTLTWNATSSPDGSPATAYRISRGSASGQEVPLTTVDAVTTFKDTSTVKGNAYVYQVSALNAGGESARSNERTIVAAGPIIQPLLQAARLYPLGSWPEAVAIGDVTGDGRNDVVMTTSYYFDDVNDFHLFVFAQKTDGTLAPPVSYATAADYQHRPDSVAIGDITGDGAKDVVVGIGGTGVQVFPQVPGGLGTPTLTPTTDSSLIRLGRLNGDARLDVAGVGWGSGTVSVLLNNGGGLSAPVPYPVTHGGYDDLEIGDVTSDGRDDLIVMSGQSNIPNVGVLAQLASGGFGPAAYSSVSPFQLTAGIGVGDVTGDNRNDVVATYGGNTGKIAVFPQTSAGTLTSPAPYPSYDIPSPVDVADMDLDGRQDVVVVHDGWNAVGVYRQKSGGSLGAEELFSTPYTATYNPHELAVGDVSGDGVPDVVYAAYSDGLVVMRNSTPQSGAQAPSAPTLKGAVPAQTSVSLSWDPPASDGGSAITGYRIYRSTASGAETFLASVGDTTAFYDANVTGGTTYYYRVSAVNAIGDSMQSNELSATPIPAAPPDAPYIAASGRYDAVFLEWGQPASNGAPITGYNIYRGTVSGDEKLLATIGNYVSYTDSTAVGGKTYFYEVTAVNSAGEGARSNEAPATPLTPARPDAPTLGEPSPAIGQVKLTWSTPASNDGTGITKYTVYRATASGAETFLATTQLTSYSDRSGTPGTTYYYEVTATNGVGESDRSNEVRAASIKPVFQPYDAMPLGSWPRAVAIGDVTGDGRNDVVMTTWSYASSANDYRLFVYAQRADGSLATPVSYPTAATYTNDPDSVAVGDLNGDGRADVVVAVRGVGIQVFAQTALGTLAAPALTASSDVETIRLGQLDGDGRLDIASTGGSKTDVFYNDGRGGLRAPVVYPTTAIDLEVADVTGDGRDDIVLLNSNVSVLPQLAGGGFGGPAGYPTGANTWGAHGIGVGDVTGDGRNDVVVTYGGNKPTAYVAVLAYNATTHELDPPVAYSGLDIPSPVDVADLDLDGLGDVVTIHDGWLDAGVYRASLTGGLSPEELYPYPYGDGYVPHGIALGDVNGDGSPDAVFADHNNGLVLLRNTTAPSAVPGAPNLTAATGGAGGVALTWTPPGSQGGSPSGYRIYRGTVTGGETLLATLGSATSYFDSSATPGTTYYYRVGARDSLGEGPLSIERSAKGSAALNAPDAPTLTSAAPGVGNISLAWTPPASDGGDGGAPITGYVVSRATSSGGETPLATLGNVTSYTDSAVSEGTTYFYVVRAVNSVGTSAPSNERFAAPKSRPEAPALVSVAPIAGALKVAWTAPASDGGAAVSGYKLYRGTAAGGETLLTTLGNVTSYTDSAVANGAIYYYVVSATNAVGEGARSNELSARADTSAPSTPGAPKLVVAGTSQLALDWSPSSDNVGVTGYRLYRNGALIATVAETEYLDSGLAAATTYTYSLRAIDAAGNVSGASSNLSAKTASIANGTTGTLVGVVYDRTGNPLQNAVASITIGNSKKTAKTNAGGEWKFTNVPPGTYSASIALSGYATQTTSLTAAAGRTVVAVTLLTF